MRMPGVMTVACLTGGLVFMGEVARGQASEIHFVDLGSVVGLSSPLGGQAHGDVNHDGLTDIVTLERQQGGNSTTSHLRVHFNQGGNPPTFTTMDAAANLDGFVEGPALGDLDGDGDLDLFFMLDSDDIAPALVENQDGAGGAWGNVFQLSGLSSAPENIVAADLDRDGDLDLIPNAKGNASEGFGYYENVDGDASSWTHTPIESGSAFVGIAFKYVVAHDFNNDGWIDIAVSETNRDDVYLYLSDGTVPPSFARDTLAGGLNFTRFFKADLNRDGLMDLVGYDSSLGARWLENNGTGSNWTTHNMAASVSSNSFLFPVDLDFDGDMDLLTEQGTTDDIAYIENIRKADSFSPAFLVNSQGASSPFPDDFDGDGDLDSFVLNSSSPRGVNLLENHDIHRSVEFSEPGFVMTTSADGVQDIGLADLNNDDVIDLLAANADGDNVQLHEGEGPPDYDFANGRIAIAGTSANGVHALDAGDVNRDGLVDYLSGAEFSGQIRFLRNNGLDSPAAFLGSLIATVDGVQDVALGDLDRDGDLDFIVSAYVCSGLINDPCEAEIRWFEQDGDPTNSANWTNRLVEDELNEVGRIEIADVNHDGHNDFFVAGFTQPSGQFAINSSRVYLYLNNGTSPPTFTRETVSTQLGGFGPNSDFKPVDFDHDGDLDVLITILGGSGVFLSENTSGDGTSWGFPATLFDTAEDVVSLDCADIDHDGNYEIAVADEGESAVAVYNRDGENWNLLFSYEDSNEPSVVRLADINRDGVKDLVAGFAASEEVRWFPGRSGQFSLQFTDLAPSNADEGAEVAVAAMDLTHLGRAGDAQIVPREFRFFLESGSGGFLSSDEVEKVVGGILIYDDSNRNDVLDASDPLIASDYTPGVGNALRIVLEESEAQSYPISAGNSRRYFLAIELASSAADTAPSGFALIFGDAITSEAAHSERFASFLDKLEEDSFETGIIQPIEQLDGSSIWAIE